MREWDHPKEIAHAISRVNIYSLTKLQFTVINKKKQTNFSHYVCVGFAFTNRWL